MQMQKPGYLTSEFWAMVASIAAKLIGALVIAGLIADADAPALAESAGIAVTAIGSFVSASYDLGQYVKSRTSIKVSSKQEPA